MANGAKEPGRLRAGAIGRREVLFQSITAMAPGAAIAASIPAGAGFAGGALTLAVIVALIGSLLTAFSISELASRIPSAGSFATYASRALHPAVGFFVGWGYVFVYALVPALLFLQLGFTIAGTCNSEFGYPSDLWWPWSLVGIALVGVLALLGITTSAKTGTILGSVEIIIFLAAGILFVIHAGSHNTLSVFTTKYTPKGFHGVTGVFAGSVYSLLAFAGFEAAAPLAEEAKDPKRTIRFAILGSTLAIGLIYVFTTYAASVAYGPSRFASFAGAGSASWIGLSRDFYGLFWILIFLAIINSTIGNANAGTSVSTRMAFALGRIGVFPVILGKVHAKTKVPHVAVYSQIIVSAAATLLLGLAFGPENGFALDGTLITIVVVAVYILMNLSSMVYFARAISEERFNILSHGIIPILAIAFLLPALLAGAGIAVFSFISPLTAPASYAGPIVAIWLLLGVIVFIRLRAASPGAVSRISEVFLEEIIDVPEA
ncbi:MULTISPECIES: APC family permease [Ferrimicrobium]|uniref:APC family permease n=1 Tax=Ferrimicrobium acidiphilum TaxID=121039 RepID=A0ABV3Y3F9_9ACTN|nr:APC family permease [Ferrimicrobium sp.]